MAKAFFALRAKKKVLYAVLAYYRLFCCLVGTSVTFSKSLVNLTKKSKNPVIF